MNKCTNKTRGNGLHLWQKGKEVSLADVSMEEYRHHICIQHHNYIDNCIKEFTALTEEEEINLQQMRKWNKKKNLLNLDVIPIECIETGKRYKNVYECARALGKSVKTIETYIKFKHSYFGRHYKYVS